ncbi:MAG: histidine phosphatase family protein [Gammaproteobacteria bacterium]|nr:MAG: histidine phosphatase family protein [Gammaproteobacteria bacterium]
MSEMLLVRHGQARLFTEDYDRLSELGVRQAEALAAFWLQCGVQPDAVWSGTLLRQRRTAEIVGNAFEAAGRAWPEQRTDARLNEFPAEEIMRCLVPALADAAPELGRLAGRLEAAADRDDRYRCLHQLLEAVTARWIEGDYAGAEVPLTWREFSAGVRESLAAIRVAAGGGKTVAVFSSGLPIGVGVQSVLQAPDGKAAVLNWRIRNCAVTRFAFSGERVSLDAFNDVSHLQAAMWSYR